MLGIDRTYIRLVSCPCQDCLVALRLENLKPLQVLSQNLAEGYGGLMDFGSHHVENFLSLFVFLHY